MHSKQHYCEESLATVLEEIMKDMSRSIQLMLFKDARQILVSTPKFYYVALDIDQASKDDNTNVLIFQNMQLSFPA